MCRALSSYSRTVQALRNLQSIDKQVLYRDQGTIVASFSVQVNVTHVHSIKLSSSFKGSCCSVWLVRPGVSLALLWGLVAQLFGPLGYIPVNKSTLALFHGLKAEQLVRNEPVS